MNVTNVSAAMSAILMSTLSLIAVVVALPEFTITLANSASLVS